VKEVMSDATTKITRMRWQTTDRNLALRIA
jgi:hypothetical protein